jgi:DNA polymerase III delta prime subunit
MCESCYAKTYFPAEFPRLSAQTLEHIRALPHVQTPLMARGANIGFATNGFGNPITEFNPFTQSNSAGNRMQPFTYTMLPSAKTQKLGGINPNIQPFTNNSTNEKSFTQSSRNPHQVNSENTTISNIASIEENTNRIREFIKRTLCPDKMDFPNMTPATKNPRIDEDTAGESEDEETIDYTDSPFEWIGENVTSIKDLIRIGREYQQNPKRVQTNLNLVKLSHIVEPLETLQNMVGLDDIKNSIFKQVVFHLQDLDNGNKDMHHTVIKGPPGVGKTQISHIIARIYNGLGFLKKDTVVSVKRDDLIAGYLGQTAIKAKKKYEEALGGVLLIDEAYALGDGGDKDSYSKEAIDLLTSYLSEHGHEFICIIAGYKEALEKRFFSINEGLARRFNIHYEIKPYSGADICQIFQKLVTDGGWQLDASACTPEFFVEHLDAFPHFGGDMQTLFAYTKKAHSTRLLAVRTKEQLMNTKKKINMADLEAGFEQFKASNGYAVKESTPFEAKFMYM